MLTSVIIRKRQINSIVIYHLATVKTVIPEIIIIIVIITRKCSQRCKKGTHALLLELLTVKPFQNQYGYSTIELYKNCHMIQPSLDCVSTQKN